MAIELKQAEVLRTAISAIAAFISEGNFRFSMDGLFFKGTDPSQILLVDFAIPKKVFARYDIEPSFVGVDIVEFSRIMARASEGDELSLDLTAGELVILFEGELSRRFQLPLLDINEQDIKLPAIDYDAVVEVNARAFRDILKDAALFGTSVTLSIKNGVLTIESKNTQGQLRTTLKSNKIGVVSGPKAEKETVVKFSLSFLQNVVKEADGEKKISIELKSDSPMRVSYPIGPTKIQFYLAHMLL